MNTDVNTERRRAFRTLLRNPLLPAGGETAEEYILVRRHSEWLKPWLTKFPAWDLQIRKDVIRLRKMPADVFDDTRPAMDRSTGTAFTKRRYALLCLALAALEQSDRQTTLDQVAQTIMEYVAADRELQATGFIFDIGNYDHRRDLVHVLRLLIDNGVVSESDNVYDINRHILAAMLQTSQSASALEAVSRTPKGGSATERAASLTEYSEVRSRLVRALLDDSVLYFHDLNNEERDYFEKNRSYLLREISEATGLIPEVRREGVAMVDDAGDLTDVTLPEAGVSVVQWFAECFRDDPGAVIPFSKIETTREVLLRLRSLRLIHVSADGVVPLAACARYAAAPTRSNDATA